MSDDPDSAKKPPVTIKKYANRRLYNTATSSYVTLDHLARMVKEGTDFVVHDAKSGEDITRQVLTHIIVEEESKGHNLLPIGFLRQLIGLYGDSLQSIVPGFLEHSMRTFATNQERMRHAMNDSPGGLSPLAQLEEMGKQNLAMFESAMHMFSPFPEPDPEPEPAPAEEQLADLRHKLERMQQQLDRLTAADDGS